jgi:hypothetical protein
MATSKPFSIYFLLISRNFFVVNTIPRCKHGLRVSRIYKARIRAKLRGRLKQESSVIQSKLSARPRRNQIWRSHRGYRSGAAANTTVKRYQSRRTIVTNLNNAYLQLIVGYNAASFWRKEPSIVVEDLRIGVGRKWQSRYATIATEMRTHTGAAALEGRCNLLNAGSRQILPFREAAVVLKLDVLTGLRIGKRRQNVQLIACRLPEQEHAAPGRDSATGCVLT